jgi:hypothetical protein
MHIKYVGHAIIHTPYPNLELNLVLHVPQSSKYLVSIHKFTSDNNIFFELHPDFFSSRIGSRGKLFFKTGLREVFIPFHEAPLLLLVINNFLVSISHINQDDMLG